MDRPWASSTCGTCSHFDAFKSTLPEDAIPFSVAMSGACNAPPSAAVKYTETSASEVYNGVCECASSAAPATAMKVIVRIQRACATTKRDHEPGTPGARRNCPAFTRPGVCRCGPRSRGP